MSSPSCRSHGSGSISSGCSEINDALSAANPPCKAPVVSNIWSKRASGNARNVASSVAITARSVTSCKLWLKVPKGPFPDADPIYNTSSQPVVIPVNHHFGRCSNRDGGVANGCPDPGPRVNVNGFLWGYWPEYAKQGWIRYNVAGITYAVGDNSYTG